MQNQAIIPTSTKRSYKSAGTHWITTIPTDWRMQRVKSLLGERNERGHPSEPLLAATQSQGVVLKEKYDSRTVLPSNEVDQFKLVREGDFVISLRSFQGGIEYTYDQGIISPAYTVIYPYNPLTRDYFARLFKSRPFVQNLATCVTGIREGQNIDYTRLQVQTIPVPPPDEQATIARFLDHADDQIQRYIAVKERLIALLEEERQAVIHQAVTRGLDPNVRLKPSGVEWLGQVPEHWETLRVRHFSKVGNGCTPQRDNAAYWTEGVHPWLNSSSVNQGTITKADQFVTDLALSECHLPRLRPGSVLVGITGQGKTRGMSAVLCMDATINQHMAFITLKTGRVSSHYLHMYLTAAYSELRAISNSSGSTKDALTCEDIKHFMVVLPPRDEQERLLSEVRRELASVDNAVDLARRQIDLMNEYRTRLIADVVTGQLDVREAAEELPTPEPTEITD